MKSFSELTGKQRLVELLRWIGVPPATALGDYAGYIMGGVLLRLVESLGAVNPASDDSGMNRLLRYLIWLFPVGVVVVIAAAKTAPRFRLATAGVVAVLWTLWTDRIHGFEGPTLVATAVAATLGTAYIFVSELRNRRRKAVP